MFRKLILSTILSTLVYSSPLKLNDKISNFSLTDQFDKIYTITSDVSTIVITFEKETLNSVNDFLSKKEKDFLERNNAIFIANISCWPNIFTRMFTLPKLRDYKYPILLIYDEKSAKFLEVENKITVYSIENGIVKDIRYLNSIFELEEILK
ncbi:MAG: hypothetical protein H6630_04995 [Arcobacter sp.]|nr:hypothetical protein [Arcobacter sp.]